MPLIASGASAAVSIPKGYLLALMAGAYGTVAFGPGPAAPQGSVPLVGQAQALGPYPDTQTAYLTSTSGQISYSLQRADGLIASKVPGSPFQMSPLILEQSGVANSITGTLTDTTLASILVPGGLLGLNGSIRITSVWSMTNNANGKNINTKLGGVVVASNSAASALTYREQRAIQNRNSQASQVSFPGVFGGFGTSGTALISTTINTATDQILTLTAQLTNVADTVTLESYTVEVLPG